MDYAEDDYESGEIGKTSNGLHEKIGKTFKSKQELLKYLSDNYVYNNIKEDDLHYEDGILYFSESVKIDKNGDFWPASNSDIEKWKRGEMKLYNANYSVSVKIFIESTEEF